MSVWQGDFGKGISTGSGVWSDPGANPCLVYGPANAAGVSNQGLPIPQWRLGMTLQGDFGAEFVFCKLVLASTTDLLPGDVYQLDEYFTATALTTAAANQQAEVAVGQAFSPGLVAGTYYLWLQRAGHASVRATASSITKAQAESTATAGAVKFLNSHTGGSFSSDGMTSFMASSGVTYKADTTNGSPYLLNVTSQLTGGGITDLVPGMTMTGTGMPSNACIAAIDKVGGNWRISIGTATTGNQSVLQNATATNLQTTLTVTTHLTANIYWPTLKTAN